MFSCLKEKFSLPSDVVYLNCATMSPLSIMVEEQGIKGLLRKSRPFQITQDDFFAEAEIVKARFAEIINCPEPDRIAIMPSVSYGMATVVKNLIRKRSLSEPQKVLLVSEEFPSDVYPWEELTEKGVRLETIPAPDSLVERGKNWNEKLLAAIDENTLLLCISPTHWADGTRFDLIAISQKCRQHNVFFVIDGTQHVGAYPFDIEEVKPDFLICAVYKWLLGPYGNALAFCGDFFDDGSPLEQTWIGRQDSQNFKDLINYQTEYRPKAYRYNMGEFSDFIKLPMISASLGQILEWQPSRIQNYAGSLTQNFIAELKNAGYWVEDKAFRASHLFGIRPPAKVDLPRLQADLLKNKIYLSYRGLSIRVSVNVWNDEADLAKLATVLLDAV